MTHFTDSMSSANEQGESTWKLSEQEPTNLVAIWPDSHPPVVTEIVSALDSACVGSVQLVEELAPEELAFQWAIVVEIEGRGDPVVIWLDRAQPMMPQQQKDFGLDAEPKWAIGIEARLNEDDPLTDFMTLMQLIATAFSDVPAVLDVNTSRWYPRTDLEAVFCHEEVEPPVEVLWVIQAVQPEDAADREGGCTWLHTHGLWRCGVPELEMLEVPADSVECAAELMNDLAGLLLEHSLPEPGEPFEVGTGLLIAFQPWQHVAPEVPMGLPGGLADREQADDGHLGVRAAICARVPEGGHWSWPRDVVLSLMNDEAGVYMTKRATERQGRLARANFGQLATAFATWAKVAASLNGTATSCKIVFGIKAGFDVDDAGGGREHLWFEVSRFDGHRVEAELVNQPLSVARLSRGDQVWIDDDSVSDWLVMTPCGNFGPNDIPVLWQAIDAIKQRIEEGRCS